MDKTWTIKVFGQTYKEKAKSEYWAKHKAAEQYILDTQTSLDISVIISKCRIKISEEDDGRVKYPVKEEVPA